MDGLDEHAPHAPAGPGDSHANRRSSTEAAVTAYSATALLLPPGTLATAMPRPRMRRSGQPKGRRIFSMMLPGVGMTNDFRTVFPGAGAPVARTSTVWPRARRCRTR